VTVLERSDSLTSRLARRQGGGIARTVPHIEATIGAMVAVFRVRQRPLIAAQMIRLADAPGQAIDPGHHEHVAFAEEVKHGA
jgi:hypothetical protein